MKKKLLFIFFLLINTEHLSSQIDNSIIITVGNYPITRLDLEKEMKIITVLSKIRINEENKKQIKDLAVQSLVKRSIKKSEIERLKVTQFNKKDDFKVEIKKGKVEAKKEKIKDKVKKTDKVKEVKNITKSIFSKVKSLAIKKQVSSSCIK